MKKFPDVMQDSKLFRGMSGDDISAMLECLSAVRRKFDRGEYIYRTGDTVSKAAMVLEGAVHIGREDYWGNKSLIAEAVPGELIGEVFNFLDDDPITVDAVAVKDTEVVFLDLRRVFAVCSNMCPYHAKLMENFVQVLVMKNRELSAKMEHLSQRSTREKLISYLSEQSLRHRGPEFDIPFNRQQLADFLSVDRSAMSKELGRLRDEGTIEFDRNHFRLKKEREV